MSHKPQYLLTLIAMVVIAAIGLGLYGLPPGLRADALPTVVPAPEVAAELVQVQGATTPAAASPTATPKAEAQALPLNQQMGLCFATSVEDHASQERLNRAVASGAGWNRFPIYWQNVEQSAGNYDFSKVDTAVAQDVAAGLNTLAILLGTSPVYATATSVSATAEQDVALWPSGRTRVYPEMSAASVTNAPQNLYQPVFADSTDVPGAGKVINVNNPWARYVFDMVNRYKPGGTLAQARGWTAGQGVRAWEVWNEPDWTFFWSSSVEDYYRLLKVAYLAAKHADPTTTVMVGGLATYFNPEWFPQLLRVMAADPNQNARIANNHYFDALAIHFYSRSRDSWDHTGRARSLLASYGLTKPIWVTESGVPVWNDYPGPTEDSKSPYRATMEEQAAYMIQSAAYALYAGANNIFQFQLHDDCGNGPTARDAYGLYRNELGAACYPSDGTARPSAQAWRTVTTYFRGLQPQFHISPGGLYEMFGFYRDSTGHRVTVVFATQGQDVLAAVPAAGSSAILVDMYGNASPIEARGTYYAVGLKAATNQNLPGSDEYMIGGIPYIVVEAAGRNLNLEMVTNGGFTSGTTGWLSMGSTAPLVGAPLPSLVSTPTTPGATSPTSFDPDQCVSGQCLVLGSGFKPDSNPDMGGASNSTAYQDLLVDPIVPQPTLRFRYMIQSMETEAARDWFEVIVVDLENPNSPVATYLIKSRTLYQPTPWTSATFDLSPWRGRQIRLIFNVYQSSAERPTVAWVDNVSVNDRTVASTVVLPLIGKE